MPEPLDIIIPVFNAAAELRDCLASLEATVDPEQRVVLVDDASTEPEVALIFRELAKRGGQWRLLRNPRNLGFVAAANRGMMASRKDVILLNSDTLLTQGWRERLLACAAWDERIATITPFSNNAEICSFPRFCKNNPPPEDPDLVAQAAREAGSPVYPDIPTAVGFCMYIRRAALSRLGLFDSHFGKGYGEENDFCMRAFNAGWRNVLCDDAYVVHLGQRSFAHHGLEPNNADSMARLRARYPDYEAIVADFIKRDPIAPRRKAIQRRLSQLRG